MCSSTKDQELFFQRRKTLKQKDFRARERERVEYVHRFFFVRLFSLLRERDFFFLTHVRLLFSPEQKKKRPLSLLKKKPMMMCHRRIGGGGGGGGGGGRRHTHTHTHKKKEVSETGAFIHFATWPFDTVRGVVLTKPRFELGISGSLRTLDIYLKCQDVSTCQHTLNPKM